MYYNECPYCGASLDPGEKYDCIKEDAVEAASDKKEIVLS